MCGECAGRKDGCENCGRTGEAPQYVCPKAWAEPWCFQVIEAWRWMQRGCLPDAGGWMQQSRWFLDAVDFIDSEIAEMNNNA